MRFLRYFVTGFLWLAVAEGGAICAQPPGMAAGPPLVAVAEVVREQVTESQQFLGSLQAARTAVVGTAVEGRVTALHVQPGDRVQGKSNSHDATVLASLETEMLEIEIAAARIQHELAEQMADELTTVIPAEVEMAASRVMETQARTEYARQELERLKRLASSPGTTAVAPLEIDLATSQLNALVELARQAEIEYRRLAATRDTRLRQARLRADATRQEVVRLEDLKSRYDVRAPFDGYVTNKFTDVGAWLTKGAAVVEVVQIDTLDFVFHVPQEVVVRLQRAIADAARETETIQIALEGWPDPINAQLKGIVPLADTRARTLPVRATLVNPVINDQPVLQPGMIGRATVPLGTHRQALVVPKDAIVLQGREMVVFKIIGGSSEMATAQLVRVKTGIARGAMVEVIGDVNEGEQVIVMGNERLRGGETVRVQRREQTN